MNTLKRTLQYAGMSALGVGAKLAGKGSLQKALKRKRDIEKARRREKEENKRITKQEEKRRT